MKRITLAILILAVAFSASARAATTAAPAMVHVEGGYGFPQTPDAFKDSFKPGLGGGSGIEVAASKNLSICVDVDYNSHGLNKEHLVSVVSRGRPVTGVIITGGSAYILTALTAVKLDFHLTRSLAPYLKLSAGIARVSLTDANVSFLLHGQPREGTLYFNPETWPAAAIGAGVRQQPPGSRVGYTLEARHVMVGPRDEMTRMTSVRAGIIVGF